MKKKSYKNYSTYFSKKYSFSPYFSNLLAKFFDYINDPTINIIAKANPTLDDGFSSSIISVSLIIVSSKSSKSSIKESDSRFSI